MKSSKLIVTYLFIIFAFTRTLFSVNEHIGSNYIYDVVDYCLSLIRSMADENNPTLSLIGTDYKILTLSDLNDCNLCVLLNFLSSKYLENGENLNIRSFSLRGYRAKNHCEFLLNIVNEYVKHLNRKKISNDLVIATKSKVPGGMAIEISSPISFDNIKQAFKSVASDLQKSWKIIYSGGVNNKGDSFVIQRNFSSYEEAKFLYCLIHKFKLEHILFGTINLRISKSKKYIKVGFANPADFVTFSSMFGFQLLRERL